MSFDLPARLVPLVRRVAAQWRRSEEEAIVRLLEQSLDQEVVDQPQRQRYVSFFGAIPGRYASVEEIDRELNEERDSW